MRIPPYYRKPAWQRFLSGMAAGGVASWFVFLYINGATIEKLSKKIDEQKHDIENLQNEKKIWQEEYKLLNKKNEEKMTVQEVKVKILNWEKYRLDTYSVFQSEEEINDLISKFLIAKDLETVFKSKDMVMKIIENKSLKINNKRYKIEVKSFFIYTSISIQLDIHLEGA
ncbi:sporulation membrane protein YtrI [Bacillus sp. T33-2]|uniref:sporulation membrane protein YtrI n=1 Tax=Bacillus sp. T33-2 TaxID=2054168 RepID=UPI000C7924C1|nr:sporulation membrane protein YtrI [Bacillus sp. T33-2]PLR98128.1 sporulation protein [Bacillus sp. T33-2]